MTEPLQSELKLIPAQLAYLAIYNPILGTGEDSLHDQILFYYSRNTQDVRKPKPSTASRLNSSGSERPFDEQGSTPLHALENEQLRQVGLAQGMLNFASGFSKGEPLESVETEKSRIVLLQLEKDWWILASIDLTRIPKAPSSPVPGKAGFDDNAKSQDDPYEYSSREVSPPLLLKQNIIDAYRLFLLHHSTSLTDMWVRLSKDKFCNILERFWTRFAREWVVLLHGHPASDVFSGIKLAAGGELGFGVGEEEWGSGERDVLEDLARRTDGLVDIIVSRFGQPPSKPKADADASEPDKQKKSRLQEPGPWLGAGENPVASDGVVFGGVGGISRESLRDISQWIRSIYEFGEHAYGVGDSPSSERRKRRRKHVPPALILHSNSSSAHASPQDIPAPIVSPLIFSPKAPPRTPRTPRHPPPPAELPKSEEVEQEEQPQWQKYLTFGYGSMWGAQGRRQSAVEETPPNPLSSLSAIPNSIAQIMHQPAEAPLKNLEPTPDGFFEESQRQEQIHAEDSGYYIIGLKGSVESIDEHQQSESNETNQRIILRAIHVGRHSPSLNLLHQSIPDHAIHGASVTPSESRTPNTPSSPNPGAGRRVRVVIFIQRPFIYALLFETQTSSLSIRSFYNTLALQLRALHKPLCTSTDPQLVRNRIDAAQEDAVTSAEAPNTTPANKGERIYDLVFDPSTLTVHTSLPSIPDPRPDLLALNSTNPPGKDAPWTRVEALNVHTQIIANVSATATDPKALERTGKTSRGWWVLWMRIAAVHQQDASRQESIKGFTPMRQEASSTAFSSMNLLSPTEFPFRSGYSQIRPPAQHYGQAILVRKAAETGSSTGAAALSAKTVRSASAFWRFGSSAEETGGIAAGWGPARLAEGIGVDARRYVEGLLSLNR